MRDTVSSGYTMKTYGLVFLLLFIITSALYYPTLDYEYVLDDKMVFTENQFVEKGFAGIPDILNHDSFQGYFGEKKDLLQGARYRPFSVVSFAIEYGFVGNHNSALSHAINIILYALLGWLIFWLLTQLSIPWPYKEWYFSLPFLATLIYILHPLHIEAVANVKGRDEVLTFIFVILSWSCFLKKEKKSMIINYLLGGILFFCALMTKENALTFLAVIPASLFVFRNMGMKRLFVPVVVLIIPTFLYFLIRFNVIGYLFNPPGKEITDLLNNPFAEMSLSERFATISYTLGMYLKLLFVPYPLTHDYYPYHIPRMNGSQPIVWLSLIANATLFLWSMWAMFKRNIFAFFVFFYYATLSIVSNILISVGVFMNERFAFIPSLAFAVVIPLLIIRIPFKSKKLRSTILGSILALMFVAYAYITIQRLPAWESPFSLNASAIQVSENSARANLFYGVELYKKATDDPNAKEKYSILDEAMVYVDRSLEIYPKYSSALKMKAGILGAQFAKDNNADRILNEYRKLMKKSYVPYVDQFMGYLAGKGAFEQEIGSFYHDIAFKHYFQKLNNRNLAIRSLNEGLKAAPNQFIILKDLAQVLAGYNDPESRKYALKALALNPDDVILKKIIER